MKRYYREDFMKFCDFELLSKSDQRSALKPLAEDYVRDKLNVDLNSEEVATALQFVAFPVVWKKRKVSAQKKLAYDLFHNVIYNYTHYNLKKMRKNEALTLLL